MSDAPTVSVVMSVYNEANGLNATLDSIRQQTFADYELVVIDDGSTDQTWEILSQFDRPQVRLHRNLKNKGLTASLNQAFAMTRGKYIARHDAQDISELTRLAQQVAFLNANRRIAVVGSQVEWVDRSDHLIRHFEYPTRNADIRKRLAEKNSFAHGSVMIRREALAKVGEYREAFRLAQDYDLWLRLSEQYQMANLPETLYRMRFSSRMASVARNAEQAAYAALARQLSGERRGQGEESTDVNEAAARLAARYRGNPLTRRIDRAANLVTWADRLLWWGEPAASYAWPVWGYALTAWPFSLRVWKFAARQLLKKNATKS